MNVEQTACWSSEISLEDEKQTKELAEALCHGVKAGDVLLMSGPIGAGKSSFARAMISRLLAKVGLSEDIPSPTFTLVQTYQAEELEIWHSDLYRLTQTDEVAELGLFEAFENALCLVEWPDRLAEEAPRNALWIDFELGAEEDQRVLKFSAPDPRWNWVRTFLSARRRDTEIQSFLAGTGWLDAARKRLAGDASARSYDRLTRDTAPKSTVLMNAPTKSGESTEPFLYVAKYLSDSGFSSPTIIASDVEKGLILMEDLGDDLYARVCSENPELEETLYETAVDMLLELHQSELPALKRYSNDVYVKEANLLVDWYLPAVTGVQTPDVVKKEYSTLINSIFGQLCQDHPVCVLRDFHAENLLWLPDRAGVARVGQLDFQDALIGHPAYDLVSLLEDARRDTSRELQSKMIVRYLNQSELQRDDFIRDYSVLGAQRNLKIIGIFTRLCHRDGKPEYIDLIPRVWAHLENDLIHPALSDLKSFINQNVPHPDSELLSEIKKGRK